MNVWWDEKQKVSSTPEFKIIRTGNLCKCSLFYWLICKYCINVHSLHATFGLRLSLFHTRQKVFALVFVWKYCCLYQDQSESTWLPKIAQTRSHKTEGYTHCYRQIYHPADCCMNHSLHLRHKTTTWRELIPIVSRSNEDRTVEERMNLFHQEQRHSRQFTQEYYRTNRNCLEDHCGFYAHCSGSKGDIKLLKCLPRTVKRALLNWISPDRIHWG